MRQCFVLLIFVYLTLTSVRVVASPIAEEVQHLRAALRNIQWPMFYVTDALHAATSCEAFQFIKDAEGGDVYTVLSNSDRYLSSIEVPTGQSWDVGGGNCNIRLTINSTILDSGNSYNLPIPDMIKGAKIVLSLLSAPLGMRPTWSCATNIDSGLDSVFQGASTMVA